MALQATYRDAGPVTVVDLSGRITLGDGSALLRKTIRGLLQDERKKILLNLADVDYIDSSGIGELVSGFTAVKRSEEHTSELQSHSDLVCRLLLEKKKSALTSNL